MSHCDAFESWAGVEAPDDLRELARPEHLLVWTLRAIVTGHGDCSVVRRTYIAACGASGEAVLADVMVLVRIVGGTARRQLSLHAPGCVRIGRDELALVDMVSAAQDSLAGGDRTALHLSAFWLVERDAESAVMSAALAVAAGFARAGLRLPIRSAPLAARPDAGTEPRVVH